MIVHEKGSYHCWGITLELCLRVESSFWWVLTFTGRKLVRSLPSVRRELRNMIEVYASHAVIPLINMLKTVIHCSRQLGKPFNTLVDFLSSGWTRKKFLRLSRETVNEGLTYWDYYHSGGSRGPGAQQARASSKFWSFHFISFYFISTRETYISRGFFPVRKSVR